MATMKYNSTRTYLPSLYSKAKRLNPLLADLRARGATYRWRFPFCLLATYQGRTAFLQSPEELRPFYDQLGIAPIALPEWNLLPQDRIPSRIDDQEALPQRARRHRSSVDIRNTSSRQGPLNRTGRPSDEGPSTIPDCILQRPS